MLHLKEKCYLLNIVENKRLDAYFSKYKVGIEVDDNEDANSNYEESREFIFDIAACIFLNLFIKIFPLMANFDHLFELFHGLFFAFLL